MSKRVFMVEAADKYVISGGKTRWEEVNGEVLGLIFVRVAAEKRVSTIALVCRAWFEAVAGPYCWSDIDLDHWSRKRHRPSDLVDSAVRKLVRRSKCTFKRLSVSKLGNAGLSFAVNCGRCLKVLQIPLSVVTDNMVERHAESLANLTVLDISYCLNITSKGIEAFGKHCKSLVHFTRNMPPPEWSRNAEVDDTEAISIADTMTGLCQLELCFGRFGDDGLNAILTNCKKLTHLDIHGCWQVELEGDLEDKCQKLAKFVIPWFDSDDSITN